MRRPWSDSLPPLRTVPHTSAQAEVSAKRVAVAFEWAECTAGVRVRVDAGLDLAVGREGPRLHLMRLEAF